ncbi:hypothetical protein DFP72DRAFT_886593 [Ephemerocybe angulata]|uniref:C2H2-type domain-containing protein n=1 Tax=Ephemerocybe angulata TaxID=980116 RepID=A0A8H6I557_9AGAR|nr:hypothetical protein DFP72DRAFT_886593 [Tulosesus angulatus]
MSAPLLNRCADCNHAFYFVENIEKHCRETGHRRRRDPAPPPSAPPVTVVRNSSTTTVLHGCLDCVRLFRSVEAIKSHCRAKRHRRRVDTKQAPDVWECEPCNREFDSKATYSSHLKSKYHGRPIGCVVATCIRRFLSPGGYADHLESGFHSGVNRHQVTQAVHLMKVVPQITVASTADFLDKHGVDFIPEATGRAAADPETPTPPGSATSAGSAPVFPRPPSPRSREEQASTEPAVGSLEATPIPTITSSADMLRLDNVGNLGPILAAFPQARTYVPDDFIDLGIPYACPICLRTFRRIDSLVEHMNSPVHDADAFMCPGCERGFSVISALIRHLESGSCKLAAPEEIFERFSKLAARFFGMLTA